MNEILYKLCLLKLSNHTKRFRKLAERYRAQHPALANSITQIEIENYDDVTVGPILENIRDYLKKSRIR